MVGIQQRINLKNAKQKEELAKKLKLLKRDICVAIASPEGLNLMRWIFDLTGYSKILIVGNPQTMEINASGTLYNDARRALWLEIRRMIPAKQLKKIEYEKLNLNVEEL